MDNNEYYTAGQTMRLPMGIIAWSCAIFILIFFGCSGQNELNNSNGDIIRDPILLDQALTCYNTSMGISLTVPNGWWLEDLNTANFSPNSDETADPSTFDIIYDDNSSRMELIRFANLRYPNRKKYICFEISVESNEISPENGEFDGFKPKNQQDGNIEAIETGIVTINNTNFEKKIYKISRSSGYFMVINFTTDINTEYLLSITAAYRQKNKNAESIINKLINNALTLE